MTSEDLTPTQIAIRKDQVGQRLLWQSKLLERMKQKRLPPRTNPATGGSD